MNLVEWLALIAQSGAPPRSSGSSTVPIVFLGILMGLFALVMFSALIRLYKRCPPNKVMVIFGKTGHGAARCIHGGAAFVYPVIQELAYLDLDPISAEIGAVKAVSRDNVPLSILVDGAVAISPEPGIVEKAASQLLGLRKEQIRQRAESIIVGQLRMIVADMTTDEIRSSLRVLADGVRSLAAPELKQIGLRIVSLSVSALEVDKK